MREKKATALAAARGAIQILFATGKTFSLDALREQLREFFVREVNPELRAVASLSRIELVTALLQANKHLEVVGLQVRICGGVVSLWTTSIHSSPLSEFLRARTKQSGSPSLTQGMLEVLAGIAYKEPVCQAQIDRIFGGDKREAVKKLRDLHLVETVPGSDGRLRLITTEAFLVHFKLNNKEEFRRLVENLPSAASPSKIVV